MTKVAVFVGSLRRESLNRQFALALARLAEPKGLAFSLAKLDDLPLYNEDLWENPPAAVLRMKAEIQAADAVLFVTPEYNRSIPAVIKNALDWGSRPAGQAAWPGKPAGIVGASPGAIGTAVAQSHLRSIATVFGLALVSRPEIYLSAKPGLFGPDHSVTDEGTRKLLDGYLDAFAAWIRKVGS
jgi:chromate reductase